MDVSFDVQLTRDDVFRFNMRQSYTTSQGPVSIVISILVFIIAGITFYNGEIGYGILYLAVGILFLCYIPLSLWTRSKKALEKNAVLSGVLHYHISEKGIGVSTGEEDGLLPWNQVYKMIATKTQVLIYSNRIHAYIIPREQLGEQYDSLKEIATKQLEKYRIRMK